MAAHEVKEVKKCYQCDLCGYEISNKHIMTSHIVKYHSTTKAFKCDLCPMTFASETILYCHKNALHNANGTRFTCHFCYKVFGNMQVMIQHRKIHYNGTALKEQDEVVKKTSPLKLNYKFAASKKEVFTYTKITKKSD